MTIQEAEEKYKEILDAAHQYSELYKKEKERFPYRLNVIMELHDDENAHSRILIRLLQYKEGNDYVWLKSFINRINDYCEGDVNFEVSKPKIDTEHYTGDGRIDGFIFEQGKYAIIIENKIWDAPDHSHQIDKYVRYANKQCDVELGSIFVIYLTGNGSKVVSNDGLSKKTNETLGNHFIPMSFQYDILPWLEEDVLPNCKVKEKCMETAIYQYIDYLKGLFGQLNYQKQAQKIALKQILKVMGVEENYTEIEKKYQEVQALANTLENKMNSMGKQVADKFQQLTKEYFDSTEDFSFNDNNQIRSSEGWFQIYDTRWTVIPDLCPHLEWVPISYNKLFGKLKLSFVLHIEGDAKKKNRCAQILLEKAKETNIDYVRKYSTNTYFRREYHLPQKTFASMTEYEQRAFLKEVYSSEEIQTIIGLVNETIEEMKKQK